MRYMCIKSRIYSNKNVYKHVDLTSSDFELYVPDISWLKYALQAKKAKDVYGQIDLSGLEIDKDKNVYIYFNFSKLNLMAENLDEFIKEVASQTVEQGSGANSLAQMLFEQMKRNYESLE